jgi:hypothetical protein
MNCLTHEVPKLAHSEVPDSNLLKIAYGKGSRLSDISGKDYIDACTAGIPVQRIVVRECLLQRATTEGPECARPRLPDRSGVRRQSPQ